MTSKRTTAFIGFRKHIKSVSSSLARKAGATKKSLIELDREVRKELKDEDTDFSEFSR